MIFFFRQFLAILLVLLQNVAPLVHAHIGEENPESGWHIHTFEYIGFAANQAEFTTPRHDSALTNAVVGIGTAIKLDLSQLTDASIVCFPDCNPVLPACSHFNTQKFPPSPDGLFTLPLLRNNSSRDPPNAFLLF